MNNYERLVNLITDDSVLKLTDGREIKGGKDIADRLIAICYEGYKDGVKHTIIAASIGAITVGSVIVARKFIKSKRKPVELDLTQKEDEAE